jgi:hypothetical protein
VKVFLDSRAIYAYLKLNIDLGASAASIQLLVLKLVGANYAVRITHHCVSELIKNTKIFPRNPCSKFSKTETWSMHVVFIENTQLEAYGKVAIETSLVDKASFSFSIYIALSI